MNIESGIRQVLNEVTLSPAAFDTPSESSLDAVGIEGQKTLVFDELGVPYAYDPVANTTSALTTTGGSTVVVKSGKFTMTVTVEPYTGELKVN